MFEEWTDYWDRIPSRNFRPQEDKASLLGSTGVGRCTSISNWRTFGFATQLDGSVATATDLEINMVRTFFFGGLVWHLGTQVNNSLLDAQITVFDPRWVKRRSFIPFLVYNLVYPNIVSNLVNLDILSPWSDAIRTHT